VVAQRLNRLMSQRVTRRGSVIPSRMHQLSLHIHTVVIGGMPSWQITLIAVGAALLAAAVAVLLDRAWLARRATATAGLSPRP
jgi:hypothetical protein